MVIKYVLSGVFCSRHAIATDIRFLGSLPLCSAPRTYLTKKNKICTYVVLLLIKIIVGL